PVLSHPPSPPEIYPLALHDALPIFRGGRAQRQEDLVAAVQAHAGGADHVLDGALLRHLFGLLTSVAAPEMGATAQIITPSPELEDRKSTRLNSSHVKISYAVFCLKK